MLHKMQQYDLLALRSFVAVVETGSFNLASEQLETSTASISRRVSALEGALGVRLLNRTTRRVDLTEAGAHFHADVVNILHSLEEAEERAQKGTETIQGTLRIAAPLSFGTQCVARVLPKFMRTHPKLKVQLILEDRYTDLVAESIDVAIRIGLLKDSTLVATRIASVPRVFCASPGYLQLKTEPRTPAELTQHNCLHYSLVSAREEWGFLKDDKSQSIAISCSLSTNNGEVLKEAAIQGIGITLLPTFIVADALSDGRLKAILEPYNPEPFGLHTVRQSRQFTPARVRKLIDFLSHEFSDTSSNQIPGQTV